MRLKITLAVLLGLVSAGYGYWFLWPKYQAESIVRRYLNDPDSAKFSSIEFYRKTGGFCGTVNAKNKMGGYVGDTGFSISKNGEFRFEPKIDVDEAPSKEKISAIEAKIEYLKFALANCPDS